MYEEDARVLALAADQFGVVARHQALELGMPVTRIDNRVRQRRFVVMFPGVYRVAGAPHRGRQRALAATLWLGEHALVSHITAATLLRLDGCSTRDLHVSVPRTERKRVRDAGVHIHRVVELGLLDRVVIDGIPCTSATRTLLDCAEMLDDEALEVAFESARRMGLTSIRALSRSCGKARPGRAAIRRLLSHHEPVDPALQYRLEVKLARLLRTTSLPQPQRQVPVGRYRIDFGFGPSFGVECEGFDYHGSRLAWKRDKRRTAWLEAQGWRLMFVTWDDVTQRPTETLERIALALRAEAA